MNREERIKAIYEKIADKTLSFGCRMYSEDYDYYFYTDEYQREYSECDNIIWHPIMLWDVLEYMWDIAKIKAFKFPEEELIDIKKLAFEIMLYWQFKRKPIEAQSDECIEFVYNIIKKLWLYMIT